MENFKELLIALEADRGIAQDVLVSALEDALALAYKKNYNAEQDAVVRIEQGTGEMQLYIRKTVVDEETNDTDININEAKVINPDYAVGDKVEIPIVVSSFGRIAVSTARQVVMQRIREAERGNIFNEYKDKQNNIITGIISRVEKRSIMIDFGKVEVMLPPTEQSPIDEYVPGKHIKVFVTEVARTGKGSQITVSRSCAGLVKKLFELEVPEVRDGTVVIKSIAREAGYRTKVAVFSTDPNVDAIGSCVGGRGNRINNIVNELNGEKIDLINYREDPAEYIKAALSPAKVIDAVVDVSKRSCVAYVEGENLSLAIGKEGQNVRLSSKLTGYKIDIKKYEG